jgi:phosphate/phosphite/phosphonate ABC transporter binding protein
MRSEGADMSNRAWVFLLLLLSPMASGCREEPGRGTARRGTPSEEKLIRVSGSDDVYPLAEILARQFEKSNPSYRVVFSPPTHSRGGIAEAALGTVDIGLISRPKTPEEERGGTTYLHLAHDIVVFATHRGVLVKNLSRQQLLDIYAGKITNWQDVGGRDAPIVVLDRADHTSLKIVLRQQLFGPSFVVTPTAMVLERPEDVTTSLIEVENSIGYVSLGDTILETLDAAILQVDGVDPTLSNFEKGLYTITRPFGCLIGPKPNRNTMMFVRFIYSEEGQRSMELHGFPPVAMDLTIAVLPEQSLLAQEHRYGPLVDYLSQHLGLQMSVRLKLLPNYAEAIEELKSGRIDAAFLGSLAFALARAQAGVEPLVRPEKDGVSQYRGLIVTRKDSGIRDWADLKGKSFGFVDKSTTAGYLFPLLYFREHGIKHPEEYLGSVVYTGSHDLVFTKVYNRELDAGAAKDLILTEVEKSMPQITKELRILAASPPVPNNVFVLGPKRDFACFHCHSLVPTSRPPAVASAPRGPEELKRVLTDLFLKLPESPDGHRVLDALGADRFVATTLEDLRVVDKMIQDAGFDPKTYNP